MSWKWGYYEATNFLVGDGALMKQVNSDLVMILSPAADSLKPFDFSVGDEVAAPVRAAHPGHASPSRPRLGGPRGPPSGPRDNLKEA